MHLDVRQASERCAIAPLAAIDLQAKAAVREPGLGLFLQAALGLQADGQRRGHDKLPPSSQARVGLTIQPTAPPRPAPPSLPGRES